MEDPDNVYIGRAGIVFIDGERFPKHSSVFCNPFKVGRDGSREEVVASYKRYLQIRLEKEPAFVEKIRTLKGKNLGCWCSPDLCHGNVLLEMVALYEQ